MKIVSPLFLFPLLMLAACSQPSPVANNLVAPVDEMVGDISAEGLTAPANAAAAERARREPIPSDGMHWHWDAARKTAVFGPSPTAPAFSIACEAGKLAVRRVDGAPEGGQGTISFTGNGHAASMPARASGSGLASSWLAEAPPSDMTRAVATVFAGRGPVEIALTGTAKLVTSGSAIPAKAFAACSS